MGDRAAKVALFDAFARAAKALASGRRLELVDVLANGERTVEALAGEAGLSVANTSQHLQVLRQAGLVSTRRQGTSIYYRLAGPEVLELWRALRTLAAGRLAEVERLATAYLGGRDELEPVTREELARRLRDGDDLVVLDVRPAVEYAAGHLPGAVSIPVGELRRRLAELPRDREIVAYCRGPYCAFAHEAFASWLGWLLDDTKPLMFVLDDDQDRGELARQCRTIGYDHLLGELAGGMAAWRAANLPQAELPMIEAGEIDEHSGVVLDVRQASEVVDGHLPGAVTVELGALAGDRQPAALPEGSVTVMCSHGERAMTAASLLERAGHKDLRVLRGGPRDWQRATGQTLARS